MKSKISHIEINVLDYRAAIKFYDLIFSKIGFIRTNCCKEWTAYSDGMSKIIICPTDERFIKHGFHRKQAGLNHLAFNASNKKEVDSFYNEILIPNSVKVLYEGKPFGDEDYYAVYFEGPDRLKIEYVYAPNYFDTDKWPSNIPDDFDPYKEI